MERSFIWKQHLTGNKFHRFHRFLYTFLALIYFFQTTSDSRLLLNSFQSLFFFKQFSIEWKAFQLLLGNAFWSMT